MASGLSWITFVLHNLEHGFNCYRCLDYYFKENQSLRNPGFFKFEGKIDAYSQALATFSM